jgi:hypothetical protein
MWVTLILPAWIVLRSRRVWLGFVVGVVVFWGLLIQAGQWNIELDPTYDSAAPIVCVFLGWLPAGAYCGLWLALRLAVRSLRSRLRSGKGPGDLQPP